MLERFVLPVKIGQKMFRALGKIQYGLQIYDLRTCRRNGGKIQGKQFQIFDICPDIVFCYLVRNFHPKTGLCFCRLPAQYVLSPKINVPIRTISAPIPTAIL